LAGATPPRHSGPAVFRSGHDISRVVLVEQSRPGWKGCAPFPDGLYSRVNEDPFGSPGGVKVMAHPAEGAPTKPTKPGFDGFVGSRLAEYAEIRGRCRHPIQRLRFSEFDPRVLTSTPLDSPDNGPTDGRREDQIRCPLPEPSQHPAGLPPLH
jgi:hypothetical protein